jgi:hypothetical protein
MVPLTSRGIEIKGEFWYYKTCSAQEQPRLIGISLTKGNFFRSCVLMYILSCENDEGDIDSAGSFFVGYNLKCGAGYGAKPF